MPTLYPLLGTPSLLSAALPHSRQLPFKRRNSKENCAIIMCISICWMSSKRMRQYVRFLNPHPLRRSYPIEFNSRYAVELGGRAEGVLNGSIMVKHGSSRDSRKVPEETRNSLAGTIRAAKTSPTRWTGFPTGIRARQEGPRRRNAASMSAASLLTFRRRAQMVGALALGPFIGLLIVHTILTRSAVSGPPSRVPVFNSGGIADSQMRVTGAT